MLLCWHMQHIALSHQHYAPGQQPALFRPIRGCLSAKAQNHCERHSLLQHEDPGTLGRHLRGGGEAAHARSDYDGIVQRVHRRRARGCGPLCSGSSSALRCAAVVCSLHLQQSDVSCSTVSPAGSVLSVSVSCAWLPAMLTAWQQRVTSAACR